MKSRAGTGRISMIAAAVLGMLGSPATVRGPATPSPVNLDPARALSGNKARLLERYQRRQARFERSDR